MSKDAILNTIRRNLRRVPLPADQAQAAAVYVDPGIVSYTVQLASATRDPGAYGLDDLKPFVSFGASPRGPRRGSVRCCVSTPPTPGATKGTREPTAMEEVAAAAPN